MTTPRGASPDGDPSMTADLTPELALEIGGWNIRYARVLVIALAGDAGISIIDPNGDGNMTEIEHVYRDDAGRWCAGSSGGGGTSDVFGEHGSGYYASVDDHGVRFVFGRAEQPGPQTVSGRSGRFEVTVAHTGWWAWVQAIPDDWNPDD